jgi:hypothetical protein
MRSQKKNARSCLLNVRRLKVSWGIRRPRKNLTDIDVFKGHGFIRAVKAFVKRTALAAEGWF